MSATPHPNPRRWAALLFISVAQLMVFLDSAVMNIALPSAQQALHFSDGGRQWVITAYGLAFGGLLIVGGRLGDMLGRKRTFIIGLVGFALASALGGAAGNLGVLLVARAGQGVFGALLAPASLALISLTFTDSKERHKAFGIYGAIATAGGVVGLALGGILTEYLNWRWAMFVNIPFAVAGIIGALTVVHDIPNEVDHSRIDIPGAVLATLGVVALVFGFSEAESRGWGSGLTLAMLAAGVVLLLVFLITQSKIKFPILPLHVLSERNRAGAYLSVAFGVMSMFSMFLFLSYYLQLVKGYSPIAAGFAFVPLGVAQGTGSMALGTRLSARMRPGLLMAAGYLVSGIGVLMLALLDKDSSFGLLAVAEVITGLGIGTAFMPAISLGTHGVAPQDAGVASAMVGTSQQVGGSIGTALLNTIAASSTAAYLASHHGHGKAATDAALVHGFSIGFWWAAGFLALAALFSFFAINTPRPEHSGPSAEAEALEQPVPVH
ncbi:MFS transporter [Streptomyces sp. NPDC002573]|uniref:MFS transporter n=1 Tax=Streptomyces sp. NPDC002573 TaxID=3364651 RepID=UPI0036C57C68